MAYPMTHLFYNNEPRNLIRQERVQLSFQLSIRFSGFFRKN